MFSPLPRARTKSEVFSFGCQNTAQPIENHRIVVPEIKEQGSHTGNVITTQFNLIITFSYVALAERRPTDIYHHKRKSKTEGQTVESFLLFSSFPSRAFFFLVLLRLAI